jgi:hypothetical protein
VSTAFIIGAFIALMMEAVRTSETSVYWIGAWALPRDGLDVMKKILASDGIRTSVVQTSLLTKLSELRLLRFTERQK